MIGRFAPSPTGPLHAGSLVAALASWLDVRAQGGQWLVRIEDVDGPRCPPGTDALILQQLAALGLIPDAPPLYQSQRGPAYAQALEQLKQASWAYPCACTRSDVAQAQAASGTARGRFMDLVYPGTCRPERGGLQGRPGRAWRMRTQSAPAGAEAAGPTSALIHWTDRRLGPQAQDIAQSVGDFVLRRADGLWAYQLAVVVDDSAQGITHVVRGEDLTDNTARQIHLQRCLGLPTPSYLHTPLVLGGDGHKLSKQNGAAALDTHDALATLQAAGRVLGLPPLPAASSGNWLVSAVEAWQGLGL